jgi:predicted RNase H-like HicB family nuclease/predicted RNA binding protein YcfA (HicA-like mRNA interferase family)
VKVRDVIRVLQADGWALVTTEGSHRQFKHSTKPGRVTVSGPPGRRHAKGHVRIGETTGRIEGAKVMKTIQYLVRINRDPDSDWGASVPDLPGCVATGKTIDSALRRIAGAIELHVRGLREDGLSVPRPSHRTITPRRRPREVNFYATVEIAA